MSEDNMTYDPPYTLQQIADKYPAEVYRELANDPVHNWRANTGIELIHREPSLGELQRIWQNWQLMDDELKKISDEKSIELFGVDNETHYLQLLDQYEMPDDAEDNLAQETGVWRQFQEMMK